MPKAKQQKEVEVKSSWITIPEIIEMKTMHLQGISKAEIARKLKRNNHTVANALTAFEKILPDSADLKNKIIERIETIKEQLMQNAERVIMAADRQVMGKIYDPETTAIDAAKISQIYGSRLDSLAGIGGVGQGDDENKSTPKIINFINTVINITSEKNDRLKSTPNTKRTVEKDDNGGKKAIVEGVVL